MSSHPLKIFFNLRPDERAQTLLMSGYFFLVIGSFWILKPIKKALFIGSYAEHGFRLGSIHIEAASAELWAKVLNLLVATLATLVFVRLARRHRRARLSYIVGGFFVAGSLLYAWVLRAPGDLGIWSFYLFGDLYSTLMVATFFAFQNDIVTPDLARRSYAIVGFGGVLGGVVGSTVVRVHIADFGAPGWLCICAGVTLAVMLLARVVSGHLHGRASLAARRSVASWPPGEELQAGLLGARVVLRSRYLLAVVGIVSIYEVVSTVLDFQFTATVAHYLSGAALGQQFASVYMITNIASLLVQLLLTGVVMQRLGIQAALALLPLVVLALSGGFAIAPVLWMGCALSVGDNALNYSINQSARESLYVPCDPEQKYQAKAFIDMFVQRFAKVLGVGLSLGMAALFSDFGAVRWLSIPVLALGGAWLLVARYVGRRFDDVSAGDSDSDRGPPEAAEQVSAGAS